MSNEKKCLPGTFPWTFLIDQYKTTQLPPQTMTPCFFLDMTWWNRVKLVIKHPLLSQAKLVPPNDRRNIGVYLCALRPSCSFSLYLVNCGWFVESIYYNSVVFLPLCLEQTG